MKYLKQFWAAGYELKLFILTVIIFALFIIGSSVYPYWFVEDHRTGDEAASEQSQVLKIK